MFTARRRNDTTAPTLISTTAWTLVTPEVQAELDALDTETARQRLRKLAESLRAETGCNSDTARRVIARTLRLRRGERNRPAEPDRQITLSEAAQRFGVSVNTLLKAIQSGRLPAEQSGKFWLVWLDDARVFALLLARRPRE